MSFEFADIHDKPFNDENCSNNYIPESSEYLQALGLYGLWLLIIGGISTLMLYAVFLEQVLFSQRKAHRSFRRHIYWIASVYPFMTMMSLISVLVPRAHNICTGVKETYMAIGITHFADLTVLMYGSEEVMLAKTSETRLRLQVPPVCCCCCCLPSPKQSKTSIRLTLFLCNQLAFTQAFYYIALLILIAGNTVTLGDVNPRGSFLWLSLFNTVAFMSGIWGLQILSRMSRKHLKHYNYNKKSNSMKTLLLVTNFQNLILLILGNYDVFPCVPPYIPPQVFRQTVENSLYFLEMLFLGCYTYYQYHNREFLTPNPTEVTNDEHCHKDNHSHTVSTVVSSVNQEPESQQSTITDGVVIVSESEIGGVTISEVPPAPLPAAPSASSRDYPRITLPSPNPEIINSGVNRLRNLNHNQNNAEDHLRNLSSGLQGQNYNRQRRDGSDGIAGLEFGVISSSSSTSSKSSSTSAV